MFETTHRQNLLDLLRPPAGYRLDAAVGTTYSLDFVALTAVLLAFVDAEPDNDEKRAKHVDSLHAITRLADRIRVFVNRGQTSGPRLVSRVTLLYDRIVQEVCLPEGCFHPKVWVTLYRPRKVPGSADRPDLLRVVCSSRNLTTSHCWEAFVAFAGEVGSSKTSGPASGLRAFLGMLKASQAGQPPIIERLVQALDRTTFDLPTPLRGHTAFLWQSHGGKPLKHLLPAAGRRALVVSPFVRKSFLQTVLDRFDQVTTISTQQDLDAIPDEEFITRLTSGTNRVYVVSPVDTDDGQTAMDLHAKILVFDTPEGTLTYLGSANASTSAWEARNCEAVVKFAPGISIDQFFASFVFNDERKKPGDPRPLRGWITEYRRQPYNDDEVDKAGRYLDEVCLAIARLDLLAMYDETAHRMSIRLKTASPKLQTAFCTWLSSCDLKMALLSQLHSDTALQPLNRLPEEGVCFDNVCITDLTTFVVIEVTHRKQDIKRRFVLKVQADFSKWDEQRDSQLLQLLLTRESLQAFLRAILFDAAVRPSPPSPDPTGNNKGGRWTTSLLSDLTVEDVIRSCTEDPTRIEEINRVLAAFDKTEWVDNDFREFWSAFTTAVAEAKEAGVHG